MATYGPRHAVLVFLSSCLRWSQDTRSKMHYNYPQSTPKGLWIFRTLRLIILRFIIYDMQFPDLFSDHTSVSRRLRPPITIDSTTFTWKGGTYFGPVWTFTERGLSYSAMKSIRVFAGRYIGLCNKMSFLMLLKCLYAYFRSRPVASIRMEIQWKFPSQKRQNYGPMNYWRKHRRPWTCGCGPVPMGMGNELGWLSCSWHCSIFISS